MIKSRWMVSWSPKFPTIQFILPEEDSIVHDIGLSCMCKPEKKLETRGEHVIGVLIVHRMQQKEE